MQSTKFRVKHLCFIKIKLVTKSFLERSSKTITQTGFFEKYCRLGPSTVSSPAARNNLCTSGSTALYMVASVSNSLPSSSRSFFIPSNSGIVLTISEMSFDLPLLTNFTTARKMMLAKWSPGLDPGSIVKSVTLTKSSFSVF
uniref:(northern house mosquito) hypothetical protein n=1 Tax=Culex pipiens TaxID=7175 RepID=A0A8D8B5V3_CULPI